MSRWSWRSLIRSLLSRRRFAPGPRPRPPAARWRPQLEALEDRLTPATFTVNVVTDLGGADPATFLTGVGSGSVGDLRYCLAQADTHPGDDEIVFALPAGSTIRLTQMLRPITDPAGLTIRGETADDLTISGDVNNNGQDAGDVRVFFVMNGAVLRINHLTIAGGRAQGGTSGLGGGGGAG